MKRVKRFFSSNFTQSLLWLLLFLIVWESVSRSGLVKPYILPPFSTVIMTLVDELVHGKLGVQIVNSLYVILQGIAFSFLISFIISLLSTWIKPLERLFSVLCTVFNPLPAIALMPLIILWFGVSNGAMIAIIIHSTLWAFLTHILDGFKSIPVIYREWGKNIGLKPWRMIIDIYLYSIMPSLIAGIRIGWGRAWRALIGAEMVFGMIGNFGGLGYYINTNRAYANMSRVMSAVIVIIIIGITIESVLFRQLEKHTVIKWGMAHE